MHFFDRIELLPARPFGYSRKKGSLFCDQASVEDLVSRYGTALYVYSAKQVVERLQWFGEEFAGTPHLVCYAVKANSNLSLLKLLSSKGAGFDIVSGGELQRVLEADRKAGSRVVFSGVGKTVPEMDFALKEGIRLFNVEGPEELGLLADRAARLRRKARIALRVNPDVFAETHPYISTGLSEHKFGIDIEQAPALYRQAAAHRWLEPVGISVHIGSQIRAAGPFGAAVARVVELVRALRAEGIPIRSIDAGGGLGIDYTLDPGFDPALAVQEYAAALKAALGPLDVELLLEPGRFLIAQAGALITRVLYVKKNGAKTFIIVDAAMNDLIRPALYQAYHTIVPVRPRAGAPIVKADIVGPVCETGDFFARDRELPEVFPGDLLAILDTGAYGMSLSSNYNSRPRAAELLVAGKKARLVRRRETMRDLLAAER
jgi:diaminopimelate decarboxylase